MRDLDERLYKDPTITEYYSFCRGWLYLGHTKSLNNGQPLDMYVNHKEKLTSLVCSNNAHKTGDYITLDYYCMDQSSGKGWTSNGRLLWCFTKSSQRDVYPLYFALFTQSLQFPLEYKNYRNKAEV